MTTTATPTTTPLVPPALRRAAMRAMLAPSVHNTQPWRFVVGTDFLDVFADPTRRLAVIDPDSRQLVIGCGAALLGARLSLAADGVAVTVTVAPDDDPDHLARISVAAGRNRPDPDAAALDRAADRRHTNRRPFSAAPVPDHVVARLQDAAAAEGAVLSPITSAPARALVDALTSEAEGLLFADSGYRAELRDWAGRPGSHPDGIPPEAIPLAGRTVDALPVRGFDQQGTGALPSSPHAQTDSCLLMLATDTDDRLGWLRAGQALERVLLELTREGFVAGIFTQLTEVRRIRMQVRSTLDLVGYPHLLLRVGHADPTPATPRRPVPEMLTVT